MEETPEQKRQSLAAVGAILGQLLYGPRLKAAQESGNTEEITNLTLEFGKFILEFVDKPANDNKV